MIQFAFISRPLKKFRRYFQELFPQLLNGKALAKAIVFALVLNVAFGALFFLLEQDVQPNLSLSDAIWWAMVTMTTVGYGDFAAKTFLGRFIISYLCMLIGIGIIGFIVGSTAEQILFYSSKKRKGRMNIFDQNHLIICNFPGTEKILEITKELRAHPKNKQKKFVLISEKIDELPDPLAKEGILFVNGNPMNEDILMQANILDCSGVFVLAAKHDMITSDERTFAIGTIIEMIEREHDIPIRTIVELQKERNHKLLKKSRVDGIVTSDGLTSKLLVQEFLYPGVHDIIQQLMSNKYGSQFYIFPTQLSGHKVVAIQTAMLKHVSNSQLIGIIRKEEKILNPSKSQLIEKDDELILLAETLEDFREIEQEILTNPHLYLENNFS